MRRRDFIVQGGAAAAWPRAARAQQGERVRRIGVLMDIAENDPLREQRVSPFLNRLEELGWKVGRDLRIDYRWLGGDSGRAAGMAAELISLAPEIILSVSGPALEALRRETRHIPIVFLQVGDPVTSGSVASLARPGGNVTGFTTRESAIGSKWLELLKEAAPQVKRVAVILNPVVKAQLLTRDAVLAAGPKFDIAVSTTGVHDASGVERAIKDFARSPQGGLVVLASPVITTNRKLVIALAEQHSLPAIYALRQFVDAGGLMSYSTNPLHQYREAAGYIDRILKGAKPADLPVQAPTKYELVINLKAAKALGLTVPPTLLVRADEVIE